MGAGLAVAHPLWPYFVLPAFLFAALLFSARPFLGLLALPALLPVLDFAPWSGWLSVDEFDVLVLAVLTGAYFRMFRNKAALPHAKAFAGLVLALVCLIVWGKFSSAEAPMNVLRVGKSLFWTLLLWPPLETSCEALPPSEKLTQFFQATLLGSVWVALSILWERAFFPGLLDFQTPYRTVGLFWEMHHGGAALDVYLALIVPVLAWAWRQTLPPLARLFLGAFILVFVYACLTTFSRGVVFAATGTLILHGVLYAWQAHRQGTAHAMRPGGMSILILVLIGFEAFLILGADSFMGSRLQQTTLDFDGRLEHWRRSLSALKSPADFLFGIGLGKFPSRQIQRSLGVARPGEFTLTKSTEETGKARLSGPDFPQEGIELGPYFALSQRIDLASGRPYRFSIKSRSEQSGNLLVRVCASHLLYPSRCNTRVLRLSGSGKWQSVLLSGQKLPDKSSWLAAGHGVFLVSVLTPGLAVEISEMKLEAGNSGNLLANSRFGEGQNRWFPQSFFYFFPWHVDNLYIAFPL